MPAFNFNTGNKDKIPKETERLAFGLHDDEECKN